MFEDSMSPPTIRQVISLRSTAGEYSAKSRYFLLVIKSPAFSAIENGVIYSRVVETPIGGSGS